MRLRRPHRERGAVLVLVAAAMFPIVAMMTYAIDVSHWFDYSRNLQNRADAAALAGGGAYGSICFQSSYGDQWTGLQSAIGKWAQLYSGPANSPSVVPFDEGSNPSANVPYSDSDVFAATGAGAYNNETNLQLGSLKDYYVRLNADNYADKGGTDFAMGDFCNSDPAKDLTDKHPGDPGAMLDVKVTQYQLPNFIPLFNAHPNIEAHARVEIQQQQGAKDVRPIAVNDALDTPCVTANFLDSDGNLITSEKMTQQFTSPPPPKLPQPTGLWTSLTDAKQVTMPANGDPVTVQLFLNDCATSNPQGIKYDYFDDKGKEQKFGLVYINNWANPGSAPGATGAPKVIGASGGEPGGVTLTGAAGGSCDPYFTTSTGDCSVGVHADVQFQAFDPLKGQHYFVRANIDGGSPIDLQQSGAPDGTVWDSGGNQFSIPSDSGPHTITLDWAQLGGSVGANTCKPVGFANPFSAANKCNGTFGTEGTQRLFAGIDGTNACDNPAYDSGPLQYIEIGSTDNGGITSGANAYGNTAPNNAPHLYVTTQIIGLKDAQPGDPPICLRVAEQTSHATGMVNCGYPGQPGLSADQDTIVNGCPAVQKDTVTQNGALVCTPALTPPGCVSNDPGQNPPLLKAFDDLIGNPAPGNCETNFWPSTGPAPDFANISIDDKRAVIMIITSPVDTFGVNGTADIPIRNFAVFYVTGWSTKQGGVSGCTGGNPVGGYTGANDPAPAGAGSGEIWGHWTNVVVPSGLGTGNGLQCNFTLFGNCIAVLTR
jgi:Putative Flp pilus-assembly TadE/G-like